MLRFFALPVLVLAARAAEPVKPDPSVPPDLPAGHSMHGDGFNEGPRRRIPLIPGCGDVQFPVTTTHPEVQAWFNHGVAQLHGFWYWEAERSFRTVLALDPNCLMGHWGMAMANIDNEERARKFIAMAGADEVKKLPEREQAWIECARKFYREKKDDNVKKEAARTLVRDLERIAMDFPDDFEARAFAVCFIWRNQYRLSIEMGSHLATDALARQVLAKNPAHPVHHYLIHLWDHERTKQALEAAAKCGPAAPGCAHMWHMPGHIYSNLERWTDAAWQQEAAARVDHAQMMRYHVFPDQIHNFAHNGEWLVRNLNHHGRAREAVAASMNLIAMPRIPRSKKVSATPDQQFSESGSLWQFGRNRLNETILRWELWDAALKLADTPYMDAGSDEDNRWKREHLLALAAYGKNDAAQGRAFLAKIEAREAAAQKERVEAAAAAETEARKKNKNADEINSAIAAAMLAHTKKIEKLQSPLTELRLRDHLANGRKDEAKALASQLKDVHDHRLALIQHAVGDVEKALATAKAFADKSKRQAQPQALYTWLLWEAGKKEDALKEFATLRTLCGVADPALPGFQRLAPVAQAAGINGDWRTPEPPPADLGERPALDSLGPFRWTPWPAPAWSALTKDNHPVSSESLRGKAHVLLLLLGRACPHCNEQVKVFSEKHASFDAAGIPVVALSTDPPAEIASAPMPPPFPVHSAADGAAFRALDAWDDFENKPLHATCFIDAAGRMAWAHLSYEPFMRPDFLLEEIARLTKLSGAPERISELTFSER